MPNGAINLRLIGAGNGKPQYEYEKKVMRDMLEEYASIKITDFIKQLPSADEIRLKISELSNNDFDQWINKKLNKI